MLLLIGIWVISHSIIESKRKNESLENSLELWEENGPEFYSYTYTSGCMWINRYKINVGEQGPLVTPLDESPVIAPILIDSLFKQVRDANFSAHTVETEYHPYFGFPTVMSVDWDKDIIDDECFIEVTEFKVLNKNET
jgi:hypothetical protein